MKYITKESFKVDSMIRYDDTTDKFTKFVLRSPFSVCYKVTQKCNYSCPHCIASSTNKSFYGLSTEKVKEIFRKVKDAGVLRLDITGGEPYIRPDINELLAYGSEIGLEMVITSNGSLLKEDNAKLLSKLNIFTQISIDGSKEMNDSIRGKGSFDKAIQAIELLKKHSVPVRINCTIQNENIQVIDEIVNVAKENMVENIYIIIACAQGRSSLIRDRVCLNEIDEKNIRNKVLDLRRTSGINIKLLDFKQYSHSCVLIEANGDFISQSWDENDCILTGNILESDLNDLWMNSNAFDHIRHLLQYIRHPLLYV